ncbi:MAG: hypothetical protein RBJ76_20460 [Stenomitos frigidus ULC029]
MRLNCDANGLFGVGTNGACNGMATAIVPFLYPQSFARLRLHATSIPA